MDKGHKSVHHGKHHMVIHNHKDGGKVEPALHPKPYNAQGSNVEKEAEEKSKGGRTKRRDGGHVEGMHKKARLDRPGRKRGGGVGSDMRPLSTASKVTSALDHKATEGDAQEGP